jgi:hypothetical protein
MRYKTKTISQRFSKGGQTLPPYKSIIFKNQGTTNVVINGWILQPNESFADNGDDGEINETQYDFRFDPPNDPLQTNDLQVKIKKYMDQ